jgi:hypothetical protein
MIMQVESHENSNESIDFNKQVGQMIDEKCLEIFLQALDKKVEIALSETLERLLSPVAEIEALKRKVYLTEEEAAKLFSLAPATLRTDRCRGQGPRYIKNGRKVLYSQQELINYLERRRKMSKG